MSQSVDELFERMGGKVTAAVAKHKNDEIKGGFAELPPINSGVAKLLRMEFYAEEGVLKFRAVGSVDAPLYAEGGVPCKGLETVQFATLPESDPEPGVAQVLEIVGKMVGPETRDKLCNSFGTSPRALNEIVKSITASLARNPIYFRFSNKFEENKTGRLDPKTQQPFPGRCWQRWMTAVPGYTPLGATNSDRSSFAAGGGPVTVTAPTGMTSSNGAHPVAAPKTNPNPEPPWSARKNPVTPKADYHDRVTENAVRSAPLPQHADAGNVYDLNAGTTDTDVDALVARANDNDTEAMDELERLAAPLGYTEGDCRDPNVSYDDIGTWIKSNTVKPGTIPSANANRFTQGGVVKFLPPNMKFKNDPTKRHEKAVDCVVHAIGQDGTITLRAVGNPDREWKVSDTDPYVTVPQRQK